MFRTLFFSGGSSNHVTYQQDKTEGENPRETAVINYSPTKAPPPPGWSSAEVTYFSMLHPVFGHNYCSIAELIRTKNCFQIYQYAQLVAGDSLPGQGVGWLNRKKKKRNMRLMV